MADRAGSAGSVGSAKAGVHLAVLRLFRRLPTPARRFVVRRMTPSFTVGAICVIEREDGDLLLVRHSYRRRWGLPGGLLEVGEDAADAARREAREEVGLAVELVGEPAVVVDPEPRRVDIVYRARAVGTGGDVAPHAVSPEIVELAWFPSDALPPLQHEAASALVALARATEPTGRPRADRPTGGRGSIAAQPEEAG